MAETAALVDLPNYEIQLTDAYLYAAQITREPQAVQDVTEPTVNAEISEPQFSSDRRQVHQLLSATMLVPYRDNTQLLTIQCSVIGTFVSVDPIAPERFGGREGVVVLWPYLRAAGGELGRMTGLPMPPMPTLDVVKVLHLNAAAEPPKPRRARAKAAKAGKGPDAPGS